MFMLKTTHESLSRIAELEHKLETQKAQERATNFESQLIYIRKEHNYLLQQMHQLNSSIKLLTETNSRLESELSLIHRTKRVRTEQPTTRTEEGLDPFMAPDVIVTEEGAKGDLRRVQVEDINKLRDHLEQQLQDLVPDIDPSKITPEAMAEAVITSEDEWKEKHRAPEETE